MADRVEEYKDFPRRVIHDSLLIDSGYDILATDFSEALIEGIKKVPVENHPRMGLDCPDEHGADWRLTWWNYESDEEYEKRWKAEQRRVKTYQAKLLADHIRYTAAVLGDGSVEEKLDAGSKLRGVRSLMKEVNMPIPTENGK